MGKAEGHGTNWHGHVTALTVSPDYRRLGLAATLMQFLEDVSEKYVFTGTNQFEILIHFSPQETSVFRRFVCTREQ